jgi:hypothetical protein
LREREVFAKRRYRQWRYLEIVDGLPLLVEMMIVWS